MRLTTTLTDDTFAAFLKCRYKAYLKFQGASGEPSDYEQLQGKLAADYRLAARQEWLRSHGELSVIQDPPSLPDAIRGLPGLILNVTACDTDQSCHLDALLRADDKICAASGYIPILFTPHERLTLEDRLRLAFGASILGRVQGTQPGTGRIVHGRQFKVSRVGLPVLGGRVRDTVDQICALRESAASPPLLLVADKDRRNGRNWRDLIFNAHVISKAESIVQAVEREGGAYNERVAKFLERMAGSSPATFARIRKRLEESGRLEVVVSPRVDLRKNQRPARLSLDELDELTRRANGLDDEQQQQEPNEDHPLDLPAGVTRETFATPITGRAAPPTAPTARPGPRLDDKVGFENPDEDE